MWQVLTSLLFFQFAANLEELKSGIPDAWSIVLTFPLIANFRLTKDKYGNKKN